MTLPPELQEQAARALERVQAPAIVRAWPEAERVLACSEFIASVLGSDPDVVADWEAREWSAPGTRGFYDSKLKEARHSVARLQMEEVLRRFRKAEVARIAWRDIAGIADLETTLLELSDLADACIHAACEQVESELAARYGIPRDADGRRQRLVVIAMGKLGAHELNFSSDIDLVFAYPEGGETDGERAISNEEFFARVGRGVIRLLDQVTADGFVYRVDMRLRPFGEAGPLALSFGALESYYQEHGRDWERYAFIKARPMTGEQADGVRLLRLLRPFVFRRYLDYGSFEQLRRMKDKIEREVARRELADNIKLGPGGIREVEFIGQAFQLIRGGREPALQERRILRVLTLLAEYRHLSAGAVDALKEAYIYLRRVENRLQAQADQQVHELPTDPLARARLACAMGHAGWDEFIARLDEVRRVVSGHFSTVFLGPQQVETAESRIGVVWRQEQDEDAAERLTAVGFSSPADALSRLAQVRETAGWRLLGDAGRARLDQLMPMVLDAAAACENPDAVLLRLVRVVEAIDRRISYLSLLIENPRALERLARLCGASSLVTDRIAKAPLLLDELLDSRIFTDPPTRAAFAEELERMFEGIADDDLERQMDTLRAFQQAAVLQVAVADLSGLLPLMKVSDRLTDLAELVLERALEITWRQAVARHGEPGCGFAIIAYGKLGGLELAYGSDLDIVFLHDAPVEAGQTSGEKPIDIPVFLARLGQRIVHLLATPTAGGVLYEVDTRLRPSGASGLLVSSVKAFGDYQRTDAWTWEHQALLRARCVAGSPSIAAAFDTVRREVLSEPRDVAVLRQQVAEMRTRMREELGVRRPGMFDLKQDAGGIADIEFLVQFLVLAHAHAHASLLDWTDNIRQLEALVACGILDQDTGATLTDAYRALREQVHRLGLQGEPAVVADTELKAERALVEELWGRYLV